ncbi:MAG: Splicing factor 3B subunit 3 [Marteilia pararefringens]
MVTSLQKVSLVPGSPDVIVYCTIEGSIGVLAPLTSRSEHEFLQHLEINMRNEPDITSLVGRSHFAYRSMYYPCTGVLDSEICEMFSKLPYSKQNAVASDLDRSSKEVLRKLEFIRSRFII